MSLEKKIQITALVFRGLFGLPKNWGIFVVVVLFLSELRRAA